MKKAILFSALFACAAVSGLAGAASDPARPLISAQPLIEQSRNYAVLNAQNLSERRYTVDTPSAQAAQFGFKLKGYVFGIKMITAHYNGYIDGPSYAAYTDIKTSGLGALLKKMEIWAVSKGSFERSGLTPEFHVQQNMDKKNRRVEMNYDASEKAVDVEILPTLGSQGVPPASPEERYSAKDTISAILTMMMQGQRLDQPLCEGHVRVFDSKQHYRLRMEVLGTGKERIGRKKVPTTVCAVYYEPINGFDPEDLPSTEEGSTPIKIEFMARPDLGLNVPVKFTYKISAIKAVIKLDEMAWIVPPAAENHTP